MSSNIIISPPSDSEIIAWWNWASKFPKSTSPFQAGWGNKGIDRNNQNQPRNLSIFCLSCTAGVGGGDSVPRPLDAAKRTGKELLIPVYVAGSEFSVDKAKELLGVSHTVEFLINGNPAPSFFIDGNPDKSFYMETSVGPLEYSTDNSFEEEARTYNPYFSVGYWAKVSSPDIESLQFGGGGGTRGTHEEENGEMKLIVEGQFSTSVKYGK